MANVKFTDLNPNDRAPNLAGTDILVVTTDPSGSSPESKATTITNLMGQAPVQQSDLSTLATQVSLGNHESLTSSVHGISLFGATLVDDADAIAARATLDVDQAGTDNSTDVTLDTNNHDYLSLTGQTVSLGAIDLSTDVTGTLPFSSVGTHSLDDHTDVDTSTVEPTDGQALVWDNTEESWKPGTVSGGGNVEGTDVLSTGETGGTKFLREDGDGTCSWQEASMDIQTPLDFALRGTVNPHIGAYPNQPFNALENSAQSVMVVTNSAGELDFLIPDGGNIFLNSPTGGRISPSFGFSVVEDANEPDIEVASGGENYSVISGDSDTLSANGLPFRQGFNNPDIGANSAPILISGGSIA